MIDDTEVARDSSTIPANAQTAQAADPAKITAPVPADEPASARHKILCHILQHAEPAPLPATWSFLPPTRSVQTLRCTSSELVASLKGSFSEEELHTARVLVAGSADDIQLSPVLCEHKFQVLFGADQQPVDLASDAGRLLSNRLPCCDFSSERLAAGNRPQMVFVAALDDLQILECLGFRCTLAAGLASLDGQQVRRLYANLSPSKRPRYRRVLVGASIANLEYKLAAYMEPILNQLHDAQVLFKHDENDDPLLVWLPAAKEFHRIRAAAKLSDREIVRREISASVGSSASTSDAVWHRLQEPDPTNLAWAHDALIRAISAPDSHGHSETIKAAANRLRNAINRLTTQRYIQAAAAASTPQESFALLMKSQIARHLNEINGLLEEARPRHRFPFRYDPTLSDEQLEGYERGIDLMLKCDRLSPPKSDG